MIADLLRDAVVAHRAGDAARAHALYTEVLRHEPGQADALHLLGLLAQQAGNLPEARALIEESIRTQPMVARVHYNLALVRSAQGDVDGAIAAYETALRLAPDFAQAAGNLGNAYLQAGRVDDAVRSYGTAIAIKADFAEAYANLGAVLIAREQFAEAIATLETARGVTSNIPEIHANLGHAYRRTGRFREAIAATQRAIALRPGYRDAYVNLAIAAHAVGDFGQAIAANERALEIAASFEVHNHLSSALHALGRYDEAILQCDAALARRPDSAEAHVNRAVSRLVRADFARGWDDYAWMWRLSDKRASYPYLDRPTLWDGEPFAGRTLLITRDQGFGDAIQMARYVPLVKALGGRVAMEVAPPLVPLFAQLPGLDDLRLHRDITAVDPAIDLHVPLSGLPRAFRTGVGSIPAAIPYLRAPRDRVAVWHPRFESVKGLRVGILWGGNPEHDNDANRSCGIADFAALGAVDGIAWYGLQKGRDEMLRSCGPLELEPLGGDIRDFGDSAAILAHLDLVIAVDTAIVHLAGALGTRVWTLLPFVPDWRWLLDRTDSPWYPTMRLFRQPRPGDWAAVFADVARELREFQGTRSMRGTSGRSRIS